MNLNLKLLFNKIQFIVKIKFVNNSNNYSWFNLVNNYPGYALK